jgi:hypothetical protein
MNVQHASATRWVTAALALTLFACRSPSNSGDSKLPPEGDPVVEATTDVQLRLGETKTVLGEVLSLTFTRVVGDSRCPVDVVCVQAGNGEVEIGIHMGSGPTHPLRLNTMSEPKTAVWNHVRVTLLELTPEPRVDPPHDTSAYAVRLRVETLK